MGAGAGAGPRDNLVDKHPGTFDSGVTRLSTLSRHTHAHAHMCTYTHMHKHTEPSWY